MTENIPVQPKQLSRSRSILNKLNFDRYSFDRYIFFRVMLTTSNTLVGQLLILRSLFPF